MFIILFLHQTTTKDGILSAGALLFIILFLHQTTTKCDAIRIRVVVVYHLVPTSNHNLSTKVLTFCELFIILFLHQTTTLCHYFSASCCCLSSCSYIKPQPCRCCQGRKPCCLSSCSYIKPQLSPRL